MLPSNSKTASIHLPLLSDAVARRVTPTDVSQFVRLEQCERFLRLRLSERAGLKFMEEYEVQMQRLTPLMSLSGLRFEHEIEHALQGRFRTINFEELAKRSHSRFANNDDLLHEVRQLQPGQTLLLFQTRLEVVIGGWELRGDVDLISLCRSADGALQVLITDMKSTNTVKVEHRLQVAFYQIMLESLLATAGHAFASVRTSILFRLPVDPTPEEQAEIEPFRAAARTEFGLTDFLLEIIADQESYTQSAQDLVLAAESTAWRVSRAPFDELPYSLSFKCDSCLFTEFCMKWSAETEDLSLLPYMTGTDKEALRNGGIRTIGDLATLKIFANGTANKASIDLVSTPNREAQVTMLSATWPVGPRLDELVHRAKSFRRFARKDNTEALPFIPNKGNSSLPVSRPDLNPNLIWLFLDAQHDYLEGRVYLLGALMVACRDGVPVARRAVIRMTEGIPDSTAQERDLFVEWTRDLLTAVVEIAQPRDAAADTPKAPIHVVFFDRYEQRLMLEALARNFPSILEKTPPLYDFLTQLAAFDSPIASFLDEEVRAFKNFPMTCQSLQSIATFLKFDWSTPQPFRETFKARLFDYIGKMELDGQSEWYTRRSRFSSSLPLEYAYSAWGELPTPARGRGDEYADFRGVTPEQIQAFQGRRLEAMEHVAKSIPGNPNTQKTSFELPKIAEYEDKARNLADALHEFVTIERLVTLADWKSTCHAQPEHRVLMGEALLVRYREEDQKPAMAEQNRENERRRLLKNQYIEAAQIANPSSKATLSKEQKAETKWTQDGLKFKLRVETAGVDCNLNEILLLSTLRDGDHVVVSPRWTVDERLPKDQQVPFTPTPKQMLYAQRASLIQITTDKDPVTGQPTGATAELEMLASHGSQNSAPYAFSSFDRPLYHDCVYTIDRCPNEWYSYWCAQVVNGLREGNRNILYDRLAAPSQSSTAKGSQGQEQFLAGLEAFHKAQQFHELEPGKREYIGNHALTPILLVQGPPGTGKSYATAFAVFARIQGAMRDRRSYRVFLSCKTHAATDVLLKNVLEVQARLREFQQINPSLFGRHFDARLLEVPLYRVAAKNPPPEGVIALSKDAQKAKGEAANVDATQEQEWAIIATTPGGIYQMLKHKWSKQIFGHGLCDLLVLDEASQMNLPEALMASLPLKPDAAIIVVGDHRQMPPIVKHDWDSEARRTFRQYQAYESLFDTLRNQKLPMIQFAESFRLHRTMAEFLRQEVYRHDGIPFHSRKADRLSAHPTTDDFVRAVLLAEYPLVVVVHDESRCQIRNPYEQELITPILRTLTDPSGYALDPAEGLGVVVPHRAQRAALQQAFPELSVINAATGLPARSAVDTVERFQGDERTVIMVSATESDRGYLLASAGFLLDPRRLTVAVSRAKRKMILVASRSVFSLFSPDEETFANAQLWKNLLTQTCTRMLWEGVRHGTRVQVWGGAADADRPR